MSGRCSAADDLVMLVVWILVVWALVASVVAYFFVRMCAMNAGDGELTVTNAAAEPATSAASNMDAPQPASATAAAAVPPMRESLEPSQETASTPVSG
jgi:hypothetical protein